MDEKMASIVAQSVPTDEKGTQGQGNQNSESSTDVLDTERAKKEGDSNQTYMSEPSKHRSNINTSPPIPINFPPPERPRVVRKSSYTIHLLGATFQFIGKRPICARLELEDDPLRDAYEDQANYEREVRYERQTTIGRKESFWSRMLGIEWYRTAKVNFQAPRKYARNHIIVGRINSRSGAVKEALADHIETEQFFQEITNLVRQLRPWWKRAFSLKSTAGFSIYECFPDEGYHVTVDLDPQTTSTLRELYHDYKHHREETQRRWLPWVQEHFNSGDHRAGGRKFGLQIVQRWSAIKLGVYGSVPILLSLALGFWYQSTANGEHNSVEQTAWTICGYIIAAASILIAIVAAVTQIGDN